jgi:hypothetical protein
METCLQSIFIELSSTSLVLLLEKTSNQNVTSDKNDALIGQFGTYGYEKRSWKFVPVMPYRIGFF